ncbi:GYD domain-containing protein [Dyella solisilvae]|uniref:GYD domain-containing protein n=1 Tax=Dyella solisilvae TaxID=1920168 RepID=A0A370K643_9GAMM|nr:GYD domain-containing protein [Dyella solisilvae]RDI98104.1 GYD domain-containing protein [Dyella solisilvae]
MATFIALTRLTDQGMRAIKDTTQRAQSVRALAGKFGVKVKDLYWTLGQYDIVVVIESDDELSATAFAVSISAAGNTRSETLRAFTSEEMGTVLARMG